MWYVYVLLSLKDKRWYTGSSNDLKRRFEEHNKGLVYATSRRRPFKLIYYEACLHEYDALAREKYLKSGMGKRYLKNRLKFFFNEDF
ncbi:MAG: GIY-YIG nuclease family protein [Candidatus Blackburnbacteria bacterium]|nr:GIY-YIG nuclease family protein [Candidatus Blackburnbacteria bacterium]